MGPLGTEPLYEVSVNIVWKNYYRAVLKDTKWLSAELSQKDTTANHRDTKWVQNDTKGRQRNPEWPARFTKELQSHSNYYKETQNDYKDI